MDISQERLEAFWRRWGISQYPECCCISGRKGPCWGTSAETYGKNGNWHFVMPSIDMTNLFKYAVPAAGVQAMVWDTYNGEHHVNLRRTDEEGWGNYAEADTPALALFLALEKLKEVEG